MSSQHVSLEMDINTTTERRFSSPIHINDHTSIGPSMNEERELQELAACFQGRNLIIFTFLACTLILWSITPSTREVVNIPILLMFMLSCLYITYFAIRYYTRLASVHVRRGGNTRRITIHPSLLDNPDNLRLLFTDRDFNAEDYAMLLALDTDTPTQMLQSANEFEINRLPTICVDKNILNSIASRTDEQTCSVCLSAFELNDSIKILPCLHRFHDHCVDKWLRIKAECPICKFTVR